MKRAVHAVLLLVVMALLPAITSSHPASEIKMDFDRETETLDINIIHGTPMPDSHYISTVKVYLDDTEIIVQKFSAQTGKDSQSVIYKVPGAKEGSTIRVETACNVGGTLKKSITID